MAENWKELRQKEKLGDVRLMVTSGERCFRLTKDDVTEITSDVNKDLNLKAKARTKDQTLKAKDRTKDLSFKAKAKDQGL